MKPFQLTLTPEQSQQLEQKLKELAKPGVVFSEPFRKGDYTIISASRFDVRGSRVSAQPVGLVVIGPKGVEIRRFRSPGAQVALALSITASIFWMGMIMNPPWKPNQSLLGQVRELIQT